MARFRRAFTRLEQENSSPLMPTLRTTVNRDLRMLQPASNRKRLGSRPGLAAGSILILMLLVLGCESEQQARERIRENQWAAARQEHTIETYGAFLKAFPDGPHADEARDALVSLSWESAQATNTPAGYRGFVAAFPESSLAEEAKIRSQDFAVKVVGVGKVDTVRRKPATGPMIEIVPQWKERTVVLDRESVYASDKDGKKIDLACLVPVQARGFGLQVLPYPDRVGSNGLYRQETIIPKSNTFTNLNLYVFCTSDGDTFFKIELGEEKTPVRFGLVFEADYETLATLHLLGSDTAAIAPPR